MKVDITGETEEALKAVAGRMHLSAEEIIVQAFGIYMQIWTSGYLAATDAAIQIHRLASTPARHPKI